ncbi:MAG: ribokinase [Cyanobacteria bacterium]|nr:ribokinase [Cyanobacteriota bacterium]
MSVDIVVVGSLSLDMVFDVPRRPGKGETVKGYTFNTFVGGKGNNQALAAAKSGGRVSMLGRVGNDQYAGLLISTLVDVGVDVSHLMKDADEGTGLANIYVDPEGDNSIIIVPRSNNKVSVQDLNDAVDMIEQASIVLMQLEIPLETVIAAAKMARSKGKIVVLNPAPAPESGTLPPDLMQLVDLLVPNESEATLLSGVTVKDVESAYEAADKLRQKGAAAVFITLGEKGVAGIDKTGTKIHQPAFKVTPVDTTAAGDAFCGALAYKLSIGEDVSTGLRYACAAGALATTKIGAAPSLPAKSEIEQLMLSAVSY